MTRRLSIATNEFGKCYICEWQTCTTVPVDDMLVFCCSDNTCKDSIQQYEFVHTLVNKVYVYPKQRIQEYLWTYPFNDLLNEYVYMGAE